MNKNTAQEQEVVTVTEITDPSNFVLTGTWTIAGSMKADKDSDDKKSFTIRFHLDKTPVKEVLAKALSGKKIDWVNSKNGRTSIDKLKNNATIDVPFGKVTDTIKSREEQIADLVLAFRKAGLPEEQAVELATKAVDNPEIIQ